MTTLTRICLLIILLVMGGIARGQGTPPRQSPFLAINTVQQDAIILYDIASDTYRRLNFGDQWHYVWDFYPDGCRILFTLSLGTLPGKLYSARLDGTDIQALVGYTELSPKSWGVWEPRWSPDGSRIVFTMIREGIQADGEPLREYHIAWVPATGGEPQFYSVTGREHTPLWSPDGQWLAYVSYEERVAGADIYSTAEPEQQNNPFALKLREADLWVVSIDGGTKYPLTSFVTGGISKPAWSPDSQFLSFVYSPSGNNDQFWLVRNESGAQLIQVTQQLSQILDMVWSVDGTSIIGAAKDFNNVNQNRLWQIPPNTLSDSTATSYVPVSNADYPRFSADGEWLALRSAYEVMLINLETGRQHLLDPTTIGNTPVVWSPPNFRTEQDCQ